MTKTLAAELRELEECLGRITDGEVSPSARSVLRMTRKQLGLIVEFLSGKKVKDEYGNWLVPCDICKVPLPWGLMELTWDEEGEEIELCPACLRDREIANW